jgi:hypothetical protein
MQTFENTQTFAYQVQKKSAKLPTGKAKMHRSTEKIALLRPLVTSLRKSPSPEQRGPVISRPGKCLLSPVRSSAHAKMQRHHRE